MTPEQAGFLLSVFLPTIRKGIPDHFARSSGRSGRQRRLPPGSEFAQRAGTLLASGFRGYLVPGRISRRKI